MKKPGSDGMEGFLAFDARDPEETGVLLEGLGEEVFVVWCARAWQRQLFWMNGQGSDAAAESGVLKMDSLV